MKSLYNFIENNLINLFKNEIKEIIIDLNIKDKYGGTLLQYAYQ